MDHDEAVVLRRKDVLSQELFDALGACFPVNAHPVVHQFAIAVSKKCREHVVVHIIVIIAVAVKLTSQVIAVNFCVRIIFVLLADA